MKNNQTSFLLFVLFTLLVAGKCRKEQTPLEQLPPETQTGANTMGCLVNGKPWLPDTRDNGGIPRLKAVNAKFWNTNDQLLFTFYRQRNPDNHGLTIFIKGFTGTGVYNMNQTSRIIGLPGSYGPLNNYLSFFDDNAGKVYVTNENYTGDVRITYYNALNKIISGTFQFTAQNGNGSSDAVIVTEGRFDCTLF